MTTLRYTAVAVGLLLLALRATAQTVTLAEAVKPGDCSRYEIDLTVAGQMLVVQEGGKQPLALAAKGRHRFVERVLAVDAGLPARSARHYEDAVAASAVGADRTDRTLAADRRLVVAQRSSDGLLCYSPAGPLTRDELDLVAEQFNPHCLPGLLPGADVAVGGTWRVGDAAAQAACLFDGLVKNDLTGKFTGVKDGSAVFTVEGTAEGIESGAAVKLTVTATGKFDPLARRVTELTWKQKDERGLGPISPASTVEATVALKRTPLAEEPKELNVVALSGVPKEDAPPAVLTHLRHADPQGRYQFAYPRDWHVTGLTGDHLVLRLLERGEFIAQATLTAWKKADAGKHAGPEEFKKLLAELPGWQAEEMLEDGELPTDGGRWLYRVTLRGKLDDLPVVQTFYLVAAPTGEQVVVTFTMKPEKVKQVGTRDVALANAIEAGAKK